MPAYLEGIRLNWGAAPKWVRDAFDEGNWVSGGFSAVSVCEGRPTVLKLTCCKPTIALLMGQAKNSVKALPRVEQVLHRGMPIATDSDGMRYVGFEIERLYDEPRGKFPRLAGITMASVKEQLSRRQRQLESDEAGTPVVSAAVAMARDLARHGGKTAYLSKAFERIADCCLESGATLDFLLRGNLMYGEDGRVVVSDPVTEYFEW